MNRNGHCSRRVTGIDKDMMTPDGPIDDEAHSDERLDHAPAVDGWQPSTPHIRRPPSRGEFRDEHQTEVPILVPADIRGLHESPRRHWRALPVRYRPRS